MVTSVYFALKEYYYDGGVVNMKYVSLRWKMSLDGNWRFKIDPHNKGLSERWYIPANFKNWWKIEVPYCWQAQFPTLRNYHGWAWYQKDFMIPEELRGK